MRTLTQTEKSRLFEGHALFGQLNTDEIDALLSHGRFEHHHAGEVIFRKGSPGRSMMAVLDGRIRISSTSDSGREVVLAFLNAGEIFGEIALIDGQERTADATAMTNCELLVIDHRDFIPFLESHGKICVKLLRILCQRLRRTDGQVEGAMFERLEMKLARALTQLAADQTGKNPREVISLQVTQQELAGLVGASRETVNKQLRTWERDGLLGIRKGEIVIRDVEAIGALG